MKLGIPAAALFVFLTTAGMISAEESVFFNPYTEYLEDTAASITFDEIKKKNHSFRKTENHYRFGYRDSVFWIRFRSQDIPSVSDPVLRIEYARLRKVTVFTPRGDGWDATETGVYIPPETREIRHRFIVIPLRTEAAPPDSWWYIRIHTSGEMTFPLFVSSFEDFRKTDSGIQFYNGGFYGSLAVLTAFNFFLFIFLKDKSYFYYIAALIFTMLHLLMMDGYLYSMAGFGPQPWADFFSSVTVVLTHISILLFVNEFLMLRRQSRKLYRLSGLIILSDLAGLIPFAAGWIRLSNTWIVFNFLLIIILTVTAVIQSLRYGFRPARFFLYAVILPVIFNLTEMMPFFGLDVQILFGRYSLTKISTLGMLTVFAIALADRINTLRGELREIESEFSTARRIQDTIMPETRRRITPAENVSVFAVCQSMRSVGGDFFQIESLSPSMAGILIADVAGHGIPAAIVASMVKSSFTLQESVLHIPEYTLKGMNRYLCTHVTNNFVTAQYITIDTGLMQVRAAAGGHPGFFHCSAEGQICRNYKPSGIPLGIDLNSSFRETVLSVGPGDRLFLFTDGVFETENREGRELSLERLEDYIKSSLKKTPEEFSEGLLKLLKQWRGGTGITDDITYIIIDIS